jgi:hypothetical protein
MNDRIYRQFGMGTVVAIGEQKNSAYFADTYVDLHNADIICNLEAELPDIYAHHVRLGEVLEHLTNDAQLLRHLRGRTESILVTVPYYGEAPYHVRLHNRWSITQLLGYTGWKVVRYIPRKSPRLDRPIAYLRGVFGQRINNLFFALNSILPIKPNGGYFYCIPDNRVKDISVMNKAYFGATHE